MAMRQTISSKLNICLQKLQHTQLQRYRLKRFIYLPIHFCITFSLLVILSGCDHSFHPIKESDTVPLSIYGYLDASADTQWVRITPIRYQVDQTLEKPEMQVTLEHLSSGNIVEFEDSLFQFRQGFNAINVWTDFDIEPDESYQIEAIRPDGAASRATVEIPEEFPVPGIANIIPGCMGLLRIEGVARLVDVQSKWDMKIYFLNGELKIVREEARAVTISYIDQARRIAEGAYEVFINTFDEISEMFSGLEGASYGVVVASRELYVVKGGPGWTEQIRELNDIEYALPEGASNVENGLGFVFGIVSRSVSYLPTDECLNSFDPNDHR